jgi:NAD+ kinase
MAARILVVVKTPLADRIDPGDRLRLRHAGALDDDRVDAAAASHRAALDAVRLACAGDTVVERPVAALSPHDARGMDLIVTVGGDGTVFTANTLDTAAPYLTVNSDPGNSVGNFTRVQSAGVGAAVEAWRRGRARSETLPRLAVTVSDRRWTVLNDCLFSSSNPAAMTRYVLEEPRGREAQRSSGVWIATAAGSTAAIRSAGMQPMPAHLAALLYKVREPFLRAAGPGPDAAVPPERVCHLLEGRQTPPAHLRLTAAGPGIALYIDGPNIVVQLAPGDAADFTAAPIPLRLILPA